MEPSERIFVLPLTSGGLNSNVASVMRAVQLNCGSWLPLSNRERFAASKPAASRCPGIFPIRYSTGKSQSQGNGCQGNGKRRFPNYSDIHSLDISQAFLIRLPPPSPWLRLAARRILRLFRQIIATAFQCVTYTSRRRFPIKPNQTKSNQIKIFL